LGLAILFWQILPTPNSFEPVPNIILKFRNYPLFQKWKYRIENNTFWKNRLGRAFCVPEKKNQKPILNKKSTIQKFRPGKKIQKHILKEGIPNVFLYVPF